MTWLLAGLVAGLLSGAVTWLISVFYKAVYVGGLINELTTFAAFTALVVFLGAISGGAIGRWRIDRKGDYKPQSGPTLTCSPRSARSRAPVGVPPGRRSSRRLWRPPDASTRRRRPTARKAKRRRKPSTRPPAKKRPRRFPGRRAP